MKIFKLILVLISFSFHAQKTNIAPSQLIRERLHEIDISDEFRNLENLRDSSTIGWMKVQTNYADSLLNSISGKSDYIKKRQQYDERKSSTVSDINITRDNLYFYLKRDAGEEVAKVYFRDGFDGEEKILFNPKDFVSSYDKERQNKHQFIINTLSPSRDGKRVAISLSEKGKEISEIVVLEVQSGYVYPEIITNAMPSNIGGIKWLDDSSGFFYVYFPEIDSKSRNFRKNTRSILYKLNDDPKDLNDVFSIQNNPNLEISNGEYPAILTYYPKNKHYVGILVDAEDFRKTFIISKKDLLDGKKNWRPLYDKDSKVYWMTLVKDEMYFLSGYGSPNYKLCRTNLKDKNFKDPEVLIPEKKDEVITSYSITKDGIYYATSKNGVNAKLYLYKDGESVELELPYVSGDITIQSKGVDYSDIWVSCSGWANENQRFRYNFRTDSFTPENLSPITDYPEFRNIVVEEISIKSYDGVEVPLSIIRKKNLQKDGNARVFMNAYGAFGRSLSPYFTVSFLFWVEQGGIVAIPHVRGGGEKGVEWHNAGKKSNKKNSWKDLIASAEFLIENNYTSPNKIAIFGGSAGGITIGRAMTERPDLFKAAIIDAGVLNTLRIEKNGTGGTSFKEYGNPNDPKEFRDLLEMDAYQHIEKGVSYPATLITTGINDTRVAPWMPAKFAAKLMRDDSSENAILLKVDYDGGHGGATPISQRYNSIADIFTFAFWQLGHPDYQPKR